MGDKADDIFNSFGLSDGERKDYRTVKEKFDDYFEPQRSYLVRVWMTLLQTCTAWRTDAIMGTCEMRW